MRSIVVFLANTPTTQGAGQVDGYSTLLTTRGRLRKQQGGRSLSFGLIEGDDRYEMICRFQSALESQLKINGKLTVDSVNYTIASWEKVDQVNHLYKFVLNTQVAS